MGFIHPVYGFFMPGWRDIEGFEGLYQVNENAEIYSIRTKKISKPNKKGRVLLANKCNKYFMIYRIALEAFFPAEEFFHRPEGDTTVHTVDHIDENKTNHHVCNLQHLTCSQNVIKTTKAGLRKSSGPTQSIPILMTDNNGTLVQEFISIAQCAKAIKDNFITIHKSLKFGSLLRNGCILKYKEIENEEGEIWKTSEALQELYGATNVWCSNKGRFRKGNFPPVTGSVARDKVTRVAKFSMHALIFAAFYNQLPPKKGDTNEFGEYLILKHDNSAPLRENGTYRNYPEDISISTQNENILEYNAVQNAKEI